MQFMCLSVYDASLFVHYYYPNRQCAVFNLTKQSHFSAQYHQVVVTLDCMHLGPRERHVASGFGSGNTTFLNAIGRFVAFVFTVRPTRRVTTAFDN